MLTIYLAMLDNEDEKMKMADIYEAHKYAMIRYALSITKNNEMAEDAVHNAFLSIIRKKEYFFQLSCRDFRIQIVIIVKNKCIDLLRQQNKHNHEDLDDFEYTLEADVMPVEEQIITNEEYETLRVYMASLDETSKLVLEMRYILGMTYKEIGEELGITTKHVDTKIQRAKEKVRKHAMLGGRAS